MILASEAAVKKHGLTPRARVLGMASAGVPPRIMGIGPVPSTQKLMERLKLKIGDFDLIELNEAFASQSLACLRQLGVADDAEHVNPHGGAIALGHPLGMSGARLVMTAAHGLQERKGKLALASMCVGVGQGVSLALERIS
jgi:3-oxoadipyl-CoA thiolase